MRASIVSFAFIRDIGAFVLTGCALVWLMLHGAEQLGYHWHWRQISRYLPQFSEAGFIPGPLFEGLLVTSEITLLSLVLAGLIGLTTALLRLSGSLVGRWLARIYLELIRNTPLLVQIFFSLLRHGADP